MIKWYAIILLFIFCQCCSQNKGTAYKSKFPSELDYFRKFVPDSLKYLLPILDTVFDDDQRYRDINDAGLFAKHKKEIRMLDSINLARVAPILKRYGILGVEEIGFKGNAALFMPLQHASLDVHIKYLPVVEEAFKKKKIDPSKYAMFVDRVAIGKGKMQVYGTQVSVSTKGGGELDPVIDVDSIDVRRASIGMTETIAEYLKRSGIKWDPQQYKKDLPALKKKYNIN